MSVDGHALMAQRGPIASEISRGIVRLNATLYGRGPVKAKTHLNDGTVVCVLESIFTKAERTLIDIGQADEVQRSRAAISEATEEQFCDVVARATGRPVLGCVQGVHIDLDKASKVFFLGR
ncbi:MAG TPA: Na-translocating system protein MpsC family protein [Solirubrobacterales bacterium]|nr:Na-translocating system protein MpsC family protein [Solirubrobacterales bacterium]